jgi:hypothetical protein
MIFDFNGGHRNGKKSFGLPFMPLLHNAFLALFGLSGPAPVLSLFFQLSQSRRLVIKIKIFAMG